MLADTVRRDVLSLFSLVLQEGAVTVAESRVRQWQRLLQTAVTLLRQVPAPAIFPPPTFVLFINAAINQINQVLTTLAGTAIASPLISPPQPGQVLLSLETLQFILIDLQQAELLLIRALLAA